MKHPLSHKLFFASWRVNLLALCELTCADLPRQNSSNLFSTSTIRSAPCPLALRAGWPSIVWPWPLEPKFTFTNWSVGRRSQRMRTTGTEAARGGCWRRTGGPSKKHKARANFCWSKAVKFWRRAILRLVGFWGEIFSPYHWIFLNVTLILP